MKKNIVKKVTYLVLALSTLNSCNDSKSNVAIDLEDVVDTTSTVNEVVPPEISYSVPTPNELFEIIKLQGGELEIDSINPIQNKDSYVDLKSKALNFGVYSADLGYMSCFNNGIEFLKYAKTIEYLGHELGIADVFDQELMSRIENNEEDYDSLFNISNETYYDSYLYLEENEKGKELALIIVGGWVESLYIVASLVKTYSDDNALVEKIGDQGVVLENIIDFCAAYAEDPAVSESLVSLMDLKKTFDDNMEFVVNEGDDASTSTDDNGIASIGNSGSYKMTQKAFEAIKAEITILRNNITQK